MVPVMLAAATAAGAVNGLLIVFVRLQPFIATLATMAAYRGLTYAISGRQIYPELATSAIHDRFLLGFDDFLGRVPYAFFRPRARLRGGAIRSVVHEVRPGRLYGRRQCSRPLGFRASASVEPLSRPMRFPGFCAGLAALAARLTNDDVAGKSRHRHRIVGDRRRDRRRRQPARRRRRRDRARDRRIPYGRHFDRPQPRRRDDLRPTGLDRAHPAGGGRL